MGYSKEVTDKCIKLYNLIAAFIIQFGYPPSLRDMCKMMNSNSTSLMNSYVCVLMTWGWIDMVEGKSRTIHLTRPTENGRTPEQLAEYFSKLDESLRNPEGERHQKLVKSLRDAADEVRAARRAKVRTEIKSYGGGD